MSVSTIFARASGGGRCGVAVYRVSGPRAADVLKTLTGRVGRPRFARHVTLTGHDGQLIDDGLALWFPQPASFTGEDVAELHVHGSPAVAHILSEELEALGCEAAGPGAFTMRAFSNGKLDLTQAEGLADLLEAETSMQHRQAMQQHRGALRRRAEQWRADLIEALAMLEASVDFPDEEDVPGEIAVRAATAVERVREELRDVLAGASHARRLAEGLTIAIVGPPNAGKSSLFNRIIAEERAIVSREAGTTRDVVSSSVEWGGHRVTLLDTAGIRDDAASAVETEGIRRADSAARQADLRLLCVPASDTMPSWVASLRRRGDVVVRTRADEGGEAQPDELLMAIDDSACLDQLRSRVNAVLDQLAAPGLAATDRQAALLGEAEQVLDGFAVSGEVGPEVASELVRLAARSLEALTGRIATDDVLDDIFSAFCIGK